MTIACSQSLLVLSSALPWPLAWMPNISSPFASSSAYVALEHTHVKAWCHGAPKPCRLPNAMRMNSKRNSEVETHHSDVTTANGHGSRSVHGRSTLASPASLLFVSVLFASVLFASVLLHARSLCASGMKKGSTPMLGSTIIGSHPRRQPA